MNWTKIVLADNKGKPMPTFVCGDYAISENIHRYFPGSKTEKERWEWWWQITYRKRHLSEAADLRTAKRVAETHRDLGEDAL